MDRAPVGRWTCTVSRCRVPSTRQITTMYSDSTTAVVENVIKSARPPNRGLSEHNLINPGDKLELNQCPEANSEVTVNEVKYVLERYAADQGTSLHAAQLRYLVSEVVGFEVSAAAAIHVLLAMEVNADRQVSLRELLAFWPGIHAFMMNMRETGQLRASVTPPTLICESMPTESTSLLQASPEYTEETDPVPGEGGNLMSPLERAVFHEINFARTQPVAYAKFIEDEIPHIDSSNILRRPGDIPIRCSEGPAAWREAADELRGIKPLPAIKSAPLGLYLAAKDHVLDQAKGAVGHGGTDGSQPSDRCMRYGRWQVMCGENLSYGMKTARDILIRLIVDAGVRSRSHRRNIYNPRWAVCGTAVAQHNAFGLSCAQTFSEGYLDGDASDRKLLDALKRARNANATDLSSKPAVSDRDLHAALIQGEQHSNVQEALGTDASQVKVYVKNDCRLCAATQEAFRNAGLPFAVREAQRDRSFFEAMARCGFKGGPFSLPVVVVNNRTAHWNFGDCAGLAVAVRVELQRRAGARQSAKPPAPTGCGSPPALRSDQRIKLFTLKGCGRCASMRKLLSAGSVPFEEFDVHDDESYFPHLVDSGFRSGSIGMPLVVAGPRAYWSIANQRSFVDRLLGRASEDPAVLLSEALEPGFTAELRNLAGAALRAADGDGCLSKDEIAAFLEALYQAAGLPTPPDETQRRDIVELFREHDVDRNERLSVADLADYLTRSRFSELIASKQAAAGVGRRSKTRSPRGWQGG
ncbi:hypothetical protein DIPPA_32495 [Diplonema papillatum]|nr:hypothetical protein DIPPA_32495 [Diplonema papillatum]